MIIIVRCFKIFCYCTLIKEFFYPPGIICLKYKCKVFKNFTQSFVPTNFELVCIECIVVTAD